MLRGVFGLTFFCILLFCNFLLNKTRDFSCNLKMLLAIASLFLFILTFSFFFVKFNFQYFCFFFIFQIFEKIPFFLFYFLERARNSSWLILVLRLCTPPFFVIETLVLAEAFYICPNTLLLKSLSAPLILPRPAVCMRQPVCPVYLSNLFLRQKANNLLEASLKEGIQLAIKDPAFKRYIPSFTNNFSNLAKSQEFSQQFLLDFFLKSIGLNYIVIPTSFVFQNEQIQILSSRSVFLQGEKNLSDILNLLSNTKAFTGPIVYFHETKNEA